MVDELIEEIEDKISLLRLGDDPIIKAFEENIEGDFNINSAPQRNILIYDMLGYTPLKFKQAKTKTGNPSTGIKILKKLNEREPSDTLDKIIKYSGTHGLEREV